MLGVWFMKGIIGMWGKRLRTGQILREVFHFQYSRGTGIVFLCMLTILSGCQDNRKVIIQTDNSSEYTIPYDELQVQHGDYESALERCEEQLDIIGESNSIKAADVYSFMGGIYAGYTNDKKQAVDYINKAMEIHQKEGTELDLAWDYNRMAEVYLYIEGESREKAVEYLEKAETMCIKSEEHERDKHFLMAAVYSNRGFLRYEQGDYESALKDYNAAQRIYEMEVSPDPVVYMYKGHIYKDLDEYDQAEREYLTAKEIYIKRNDPFHEASVNLEIASVYLEREEYEKSIDLNMQALEGYTALNYDIEGQILAYANIAYACREIRDYENALDNAIAACRLLEDDVSLEIDPEGICKANLSLYYSEWTDNKMEEDFESWYKRVVLDGEDWR